MAFLFSRKHKQGKTWYVGYYVDGRLIRKKIGNSKVLAEKARGDIEAKIERGDSGLVKKDYPIFEFFSLYLERTQPRSSESYHKRNTHVIKHFTRFLNKKAPYISKLSQIKPVLIEDYQNFRLLERIKKSGQPIKKRTINIEIGSLKTFLNKAVKWELLPDNPIKNIEYFKEDDSKEIRSFTENEVKLLLIKAVGWFKPVLITALHTGMREGEIIHLEWSDVNFNKKTISIRKKVDWLPKSTGRSIRERSIAISDDLAEFLKKHKKRSSSKNDSYVFHNSDGNKLRTGLRRALMRLTKELGFPEVTQFHALRHTYTTHLIDACKDLAVVQDQLGHSDIRTTMRYSDMTMDRKHKAVKKLSFGFLKTEK